MTLQNMGLNARSFMGWQLVKASGVHGNARVESIEAATLDEALSGGAIAVIPGFQGITAEGDVATLGRGGSDTSAVALAVAVNADRCDIYTDVEGVFTTDPRIVPRARKLSAITYEEMLELASVGAKVLQTRSVGLAMRYGMALQVLSSFEDRPGTLIVSDDQIEELNMEQQLITGIAHDKNEARVTLSGLPDKPGTVAAIFAPLAKANINVDMIVQSGAGTGRSSSLTFTVPTGSLAHAVAELEKAKGTIGFDEVMTNTDVVKVSAVGIGMRSNAGIAAKMFETLAERGINILAISTSEIKVSVLLPEEYTELAVRVLHTAFGLDAAEQAA
jgi:aspartate kinase